MEITDNPPKSIQFINEHGQIMEQEVKYEWLPIKCKTCAGFGHSMAECRKDKKVQWARKETEHPSEEEQGPGEHQAGKIEESEIQASSEVNKDQVDPVESVLPNEEVVAEVKSNQPWRTPKRIAAQVKEGQRSVTLANNAGHKNKNSNKFVVLQEPMVNGKEETKLKGCKINKFMESQFPHWDFHTSSIIKGRLLIIWRRLNVKITILEESTQVVHCLVKVMGVQQDFGVSFVYGFNSIEGRRSLWDGLQRPSHLVKAWLYLGDFNAPFSSKDRMGGKPISNTELADSIKWLAVAHVEQLQNIGSYFTWTNNQDGAARIYSKIDHVLSNEKCFDLFSQSTTIFRWEGISDPCSCLVRV
ncbi:uncharacterized protein LOC133824313 [Humulus lupulus]|uniref:uncharacterized protein LOC133824313 n=1 Tax=Humulus lupulus TaxID=3486 RepID=UPI002B417222|nr:uncharacterized protein LOC133824313 [Humulus lupulus]